jgi:hypothetical protein
MTSAIRAAVFGPSARFEVSCLPAGDTEKTFSRTV